MIKVSFVAHVVVAVCILALLGWKYNLYFQQKDFYLYGESLCTPQEQGRCFPQICESEEECDSSVGYKEIIIPANAALCDSSECDPFMCEEGFGCEITYCDPEAQECM